MWKGIELPGKAFCVQTFLNKEQRSWWKRFSPRQENQSNSCRNMLRHSLTSHSVIIGGHVIGKSCKQSIPIFAAKLRGWWEKWEKWKCGNAAAVFASPPLPGSQLLMDPHAVAAENYSLLLIQLAKVGSDINCEMSWKQFSGRQRALVQPFLPPVQTFFFFHPIDLCCLFPFSHFLDSTPVRGVQSRYDLFKRISQENTLQTDKLETIATAY